MNEVSTLAEVTVTHEEDAPNQVTQTRSFNDLSGGNVTALLQSATNPENGTVSYTYDPDNTLATKTDARGQVVSYTYDLFQRVTGITSGGGQGVAFYYDTDPDIPYGNFAQNAWGRLAAVQYQSGSPHTFTETYSYNTAGQTVAKRLQITYNCQWTYNPNGNYPPPYPCGSAQMFTLTGSWTYDGEGRMTGQTWPQDYAGVNPSVTYGYGAAGRPSTLTETSNTGMSNIVASVSYNAADQPLSYTGSSGAFYNYGESWTYNVLGQITSHQATPICCTATAINVTYDYGAAGQNNGQIASRTNVISGEQVVYTYDALNRLIKAQTAANTWGQGFVYDGFGNLLQKNVTAGSAQTVDSGNHINGVTYDAAGNPTQMSVGGFFYNQSESLTWDADERLILDSSGKPMDASTLSGLAISERFWNVSGDTGLQSNASTWTTANGTIQPNGTLTDYLSAGGLPPLTNPSGSAFQGFTATGFLSNGFPLVLPQPLTVEGFGAATPVLNNVYTSKNVTINGLGLGTNPATKCH